MDKAITYEQPLSEIFRVCLRLEYLFEQLDHALQDSSYLGTRNLIIIIVNILQLLDRPDLKTKLAKELTHQTAQLLRLESMPQTDKDKLHEVIHQLEELSRCFIDSSGKIGQNLREIALLNNLRLHLMTPGGGLSFDIPIYNYWLNRPEQERLETVKTWLNEFQQLRTAIHLLLRLVRESTPFQTKSATHGFYQELLDPQQNIRIIRVSISPSLDAYPEVSVGRHFVSIRFFVPQINIRPAPYQQNLSFGLAYCNA
ncbi:MAG TPA: cell division protein ZapD [Gammaproteobacteria bacterium]|nr:cell division protein ZapD [Gammaproteobacteria bacterium]